MERDPDCVQYISVARRHYVRRKYVVEDNQWHREKEGALGTGGTCECPHISVSIYMYSRAANQLLI